MAKELPTLFDRLLSDEMRKLPGTRGRVRLVKRLEKIRARIRLADKVVFNQDASTRVGEVLRDIPELLVEQIEFARAPFDVCWIEYRADALIKALQLDRSNMYTDYNDPEDLTADETVGFLVDHNRVNVFFRSLNDQVGFLPWAYHLKTEWPVDDQRKFAERFSMSRLGIDCWLWGATANKFIADGRGGYLRALRDTTMVEEMDNYYENHNRADRARIFDGCNGDFKNVVACLLMLNQPRLTQYVHVPRRQGWIGNKHRPFMAYHNINVALDAGKQIRLVSEGGGVPVMRRGGKVRGHYCHDEVARDYARIAGCVHDWVATDDKWCPTPYMPLDEREHWQCKVCEGKRWWRSEHTRGGTGFVHHSQYTVTK